jgi:dynein heavy chain, axonemal
MINPDYRLWLTTFSSPSFPVPVLQSGVKVTNEPPKGLKANMAGTFENTGEEQFEACVSKPREYKKLLFALSYFHACILERRKYGAIGWNERYDWMNADFECSNMTLHMLVEEQPDVPYQALNIIISQVNYGGRVTDERDVRTISAILKKYFTPEIMSDNYKLSKLDVYYAPPEGTFAQTKEYLSTLPLEEDPEVFGLHPNANMIYETGTVMKFLDAVISIQPRIASAGTGKTPEQEAREMAQAFTKILPKNINRELAHPDTFKNDESGKPLSLGTFCNQEVERFNYLLSTMR